MASLSNNPDAYKLYDVAVKLAVNNDWMLEGGWGMYLVSTDPAELLFG